MISVSPGSTQLEYVLFATQDMLSLLVETVLLINLTHNSINRIYYAVCGEIESACNVLRELTLIKMESVGLLMIFVPPGIVLTESASLAIKDTFSMEILDVL